MLSLLLSAGSVGAQPAPPLLIDGTRSTEAARARLERVDPASLAAVTSLVGLDDPGGAIDVVLVDESEPLAASLPAWVAGFAEPSGSRIVLFPARAESYPHDSLEDVLRHEVAHVLAVRAAGRPLPRWFSEGLAMAAERPWGLDDRLVIAWGSVWSGALGPDEVDRLFGGSRGEAARGYAFAAAMVRDLLGRHGPDAGARVLRAMAEGRPFVGAWGLVAGETPARSWHRFWGEQTAIYRWVPLVTGSAAVWIATVGLAVYAFRRRRARSAALRRAWADDESAAAGTSDGDPRGPRDPG